MESKRSAEDKSNFHYDFKYLNSVSSVLEHSSCSKDIYFRKIEEIVDEKWKKKEQSYKRPKQLILVKKNSKQAKRKNKLNINKMRKYISQNVQKNSKYII